LKLNSILIRSAIVGALGGLLFGFDTAVISGTTHWLTITFGLSPAELGLTVSIALWGTVVGSIFAAIPAIAMAFIDSPHKALVVGIGYIVIQFVENHVLVPVLMKHGVNLPPAMTLGIQALMALLFGFLGLLVAVPLLAAILTIVRTMNEKELREISEETSSRLPAGDEAIERAFDHRTGNYQ